MGAGYNENGFTYRLVLKKNEHPDAIVSFSSFIVGRKKNSIVNDPFRGFSSRNRYLHHQREKVLRTRENPQTITITRSKALQRVFEMFFITFQGESVMIFLCTACKWYLRPILTRGMLLITF